MILRTILALQIFPSQSINYDYVLPFVPFFELPRYPLSRSFYCLMKKQKTYFSLRPIFCSFSEFLALPAQTLVCNFVLNDEVDQSLHHLLRFRHLGLLTNATQTTFLILPFGRHLWRCYWIGTAT